MPQSTSDINSKIQAGKAQVVTALVLKKMVQTLGIKKVAEQVDVITTGVFEVIESAGAIINLGHTDPPIRLRSCWLDGVLAYTGLGAVDLYLGATQESDSAEEGQKHRTGAQVIADLIAGKSVTLKAIALANDCYPRTSLDTTITKDSINQFYLYNPRGLYQNFIVGVNSGEDILYTYLGPLQPRLGNAVYANPGAIAPLWNDPDLRLVGIGSKIWLGGGIGYIVGEGTQHFPLQKRLENRTPIGPASTLAIVGDAKTMDSRWVRACYFRNYGSALMMGVGMALPVVDEIVVAQAAVQDHEIVAPIVDFSIPRRARPSFGTVSYAELKSGKITINGQTVRTAPLSSIYLAERIAIQLKTEIEQGKFLLTTPTAPIPSDRTFIAQDLL
ncbi:MAG: homocysteine biosynthesis protein [Pseudanabaenaceae cyanobacterium]